MGGRKARFDNSQEIGEKRRINIDKNKVLLERNKFKEVENYASAEADRRKAGMCLPKMQAVVL
jgi:hypothetical protein